MESEEHATDALSGGMMAQGYQCGMLWGSTLAAGAEAYRLYGSGPKAETMAILAAQNIVETFRAQNHNINCMEITEINLSKPTTRMVLRFLAKTGARGSCFGMAARCAKAAFRDINTTFAEQNVEIPSQPVSCAAMVAQKMGASEIQAVMAAGLAGGIGLSGGACGALGAAIWLRQINSRNEGSGMAVYQDPVALGTMERYLASADYEFECEKVVGKKFENAADHANFVREGGCSKIIQALAEADPPEE